jgi:hypothetical protein
MMRNLFNEKRFCFQNQKQLNPCRKNIKLSVTNRGIPTQNVNIMKTATRAISKSLSGFGLLILTACLLFAPAARAGLTVDMHLYHDNNGYFCFPLLSTNTTTPNNPSNSYFASSLPGNIHGELDAGSTFSQAGSGYFGTLGSLFQELTNGNWSLRITNNISTNQYSFTVSITGVTSNQFAPVIVTFPANGAVSITNTPTFTWQGPTNWQGTLNVNENFTDANGNNYGEASASLPASQTNWPCPVVIPNGTNNFSADYQSNVTALIVAHTPTNNLLQPLSGWVSTATLETYYNSQFTVGQPANDYDPFLVARYDFEDTNNPYSDSSGNNNNPDYFTTGATNDTFSTDDAVGQYARLFFGDTSFSFTQDNPAYQNFSNALSGNFSVTAWVKTTNSVNTDYANAYFGAPIFFAGADYNDDCTIPLSITGSKAAFTVVANEGPGTVTLQSTTSVNDGNYHFLAVTRQMSSGLMSVYVDGNLETTGTGITTPVITQGYISIAGGYNFFDGLLDDVRIYSTNLSASDVAILHNSGNLPTLAGAIGATNLAVTTSGDANWFVENTNTYNGAPAADQSGSVINYQTTTLTATITGPGTLTFNWSSIANDPNQGFDYRFYIDDPNTNDITDLYGDNPWQSIQQTTGHFISIPPGQHTLGWIVYANGDTDPTEAGFLDNVLFTPPDTNPVSASITFNIYREQDPTFGDFYAAFPSFNSVTPAATGTTTNVIQSPNNYFSGQSDQGGGSSGSGIFYSLGTVLNESTNGLWSLYINYGMPNQRQFQFSVAINGLATNLLPAVKMIAPTNGATGFPSTAAIQWLGPANYSSLNVSKQNIDGSASVAAALPVTATSWTPGLIVGTNQCNISYASNNFPSVSFSVPVDSADSETAAVWSAAVNLNTTAESIFVVTAGASHVTLLSPQAGGGNFQFSFQSQTGFTNTVQYRTNLVLGTWQAYTNIPGDGTLKTIPVPLSVFSPAKQGFIRVSTQ